MRSRHEWAALLRGTEGFIKLDESESDELATLLDGPEPAATRKGLVDASDFYRDCPCEYCQTHFANHPAATPLPSAPREAESVTVGALTSTGGFETTITVPGTGDFGALREAGAIQSGGETYQTGADREAAAPRARNWRDSEAVRNARALFNEACHVADTVYDADVQDRLDSLLEAVSRASSSEPSTDFEVRVREILPRPRRVGRREA